MTDTDSAPPINVLVVSISPDMKAEGIAAAVDRRDDMHLVRPSEEARRLVLKPAEGNALLEQLPSTPPCALVLVGPPAATNVFAEGWLARRADLVVMHVEIVADTVRISGITLRDPSLPALLSALRGLVERVRTQPQHRVSRVQLHSVSVLPDANEARREAGASERPLLLAANDWIHTLLRAAVERVPDQNGDVHGLSLTKTTLLQLLDAPSEPEFIPFEVREADVALDRALRAADAATEPLAGAAHVFRLSGMEFRVLLLALAPELDHRFQRCVGFLLDELSRRVGTLGLYASLLGGPLRVRSELIADGSLTQWRIFDASPGRLGPADEPLRIDPFFAEWLLGDWGALRRDPRIRRVMRVVPWPGARLLEGKRAVAARLVEKLRHAGVEHWLVLEGDDPADWRALLELGAASANIKPIRINATRFAGIDAIEIEEVARRIGRLARLTDAPLIIDATSGIGSEGEEESMRLFLATIGRALCRAAVICTDEARLVGLIGAASYELMDKPVSKADRIDAVRSAANGADAYLSEEAADVIAGQYPLRVDGFEEAMHLAHGRPLNYDVDNPRLHRFIAACKEVAAEGISHLADRIEPVFTLDNVVLPADRKQQLVEIVDNVRLASHVLDEWKFRDQLPYGRGVAALFFGPSGTGKTMAAIGVAHALRSQILRLDLSRVVSKYIGDTEKNVDRVFDDAHQSGSVILIDEADALLGKRSEQKDSLDRYSNIEVAYLLQRLEGYEGLTLLTTNFRQNLDPALVRRLRFIVEFPRPDIEAREKIWRYCLPVGSHVLDDAAFRLLARRIDLTGGHIRQITLRAAFIAAAAGTQIRVEHIAQATRAELAKLGLPPVELELVEERRAA